MKAFSFAVHGHAVEGKRLDTDLWLVSVDGHPIARFSSESRARAAGRAEAQRRVMTATSRNGGFTR